MPNRTTGVAKYVETWQILINVVICEEVNFVLNQN